MNHHINLLQSILPGEKSNKMMIATEYKWSVICSKDKCFRIMVRTLYKTNALEIDFLMPFLCLFMD